MNMRLLVPALLGFTAVSSLLLTGCVVEERHPRRAVVVRTVPPPPPPGEIVIGTEIRVAGPPPPVVKEVIIARPGPHHMWIPGAWVWEGRWVWHKGHWALPPRAGAVWVPHRCEVRGGVHVYIHGGWRF